MFALTSRENTNPKPIRKPKETKLHKPQSRVEDLGCKVKGLGLNPESPAETLDSWPDSNKN